MSEWDSSPWGGAQQAEPYRRPSTAPTQHAPSPPPFGQPGPEQDPRFPDPRFADPQLQDPLPSPWQAHHPHRFGLPPRPTLPSGLKVLAIVLSALKALPLGLMLLVAGVFASASNDVGGPVSEVLDIALVILIGIIVIGAVLLLGQLLAAVKNSKLWLAIFAGVLAALDTLMVIGSISSLADDTASATAGSDDGVAGVWLLVIVAACQIATFIWALAADTDH